MDTTTVETAVVPTVDAAHALIENTETHEITKTLTIAAATIGTLVVGSFVVKKAKAFAIQKLVERKMDQIVDVVVEGPVVTTETPAPKKETQKV